MKKNFFYILIVIEDFGYGSAGQKYESVCQK